MQTSSHSPWDVVISSVSSHCREAYALHLSARFALSSEECAEIFNQLPVIFLSCSSREAALQLQQTISIEGAEVLLTQEKNIREKCHRVLWTQTDTDLNSLPVIQVAPPQKIVEKKAVPKSESLNELDRRITETKALYQNLDKKYEHLVRATAQTDEIAAGTSLEKVREALNEARGKVSYYEETIAFLTGKTEQLDGELMILQQRLALRESLLESETSQNQNLLMNFRKIAVEKQSLEAHLNQAVLKIQQEENLNVGLRDCVRELDQAGNAQGIFLKQKTTEWEGKRKAFEETAQTLGEQLAREQAKSAELQKNYEYLAARLRESEQLRLKETAELAGKVQRQEKSYADLEQSRVQAEKEHQQKQDHLQAALAYGQSQWAETQKVYTQIKVTLRESEQLRLKQQVESEDQIGKLEQAITQLKKELVSAEEKRTQQLREAGTQMQNVITKRDLLLKEKDQLALSVQAQFEKKIEEFQRLRESQASEAAAQIQNEIKKRELALKEKDQEAQRAQTRFEKKIEELQWLLESQKLEAQKERELLQGDIQAQLKQHASEKIELAKKLEKEHILAGKKMVEQLREAGVQTQNEIAKRENLQAQIQEQQVQIQEQLEKHLFEKTELERILNEQQAVSEKLKQTVEKLEKDLTLAEENRARQLRQAQTQAEEEIAKRELILEQKTKEEKNTWNQFQQKVEDLQRQLEHQNFEAQKARELMQDQVQEQIKRHTLEKNKVEKILNEKLAVSEEALDSLRMQSAKTEVENKSRFIALEESLKSQEFSFKEKMAAWEASRKVFEAKQTELQHLLAAERAALAETQKKFANREIELTQLLQEESQKSEALKKEMEGYGNLFFDKGAQSLMAKQKETEAETEREREKNAGLLKSLSTLQKENERLQLAFHAKLTEFLDLQQHAAHKEGEMKAALDKELLRTAALETRAARAETGMYQAMEEQKKKFESELTQENKNYHEWHDKYSALETIKDGILTTMKAERQELIEMREAYKNLNEKLAASDEEITLWKKETQVLEKKIWELEGTKKHFPPEADPSWQSSPGLENGLKESRLKDNQVKAAGGAEQVTLKGKSGPQPLQIILELEDQKMRAQEWERRARELEKELVIFRTRLSS